MKRPQVIVVAAAAIILGLFWLTYTTHPEPRFKGKSLSEWLDLCYKSSAPIPEAADAVRHMGTDAVPFLVTWVQQDRPMSPRETRWWEKVGRWKSGTPGRELLLEFINRRRWEHNALPGASLFWAALLEVPLRIWCESQPMEALIVQTLQSPPSATLGEMASSHCSRSSQTPMSRRGPELGACTRSDRCLTSLPTHAPP